MEAIWKSPNTIIGSVARGNNYYERPQIVNDIWNDLEKGNYILIAAPRRVGKTSVMTHMIENPKEGYKLVFENVQGNKSETEFYKALYRLILSCLTKSNQAKRWVVDYLKTKSITEASIDGNIKISNRELDYLNEINEVIPLIEKDGETIVLFIDELPEVLFNLHKKGKAEEAMSILKNLRRWRQDIQFQKLRLVLAGSIGIHYVVNAIEGRT
ncbi:MAG: AAA-like domain-containing protein, partial [Paludibacter sp.]|nr:AAA-like domain-containing protein [Paludibacter sp.]